MEPPLFGHVATWKNIEVSLNSEHTCTEAFSACKKGGGGGGGGGNSSLLPCMQKAGKASYEAKNCCFKATLSLYNITQTNKQTLPPNTISTAGML